MKKLLSILLSCSVLFTGCYSYQTISDTPSGHFPSQDKKIIVTFNDNTSIELEAYNHIYVSESSELLYGKFRSLNTLNGDSKEAIGWFAVTPADSCVMSQSAQGKEILTCYRGAEEIIFFENVISKHSATPGFWISGNRSEIKGPFQSSDIQSIETEQLDGTKTALVVAGVALVVLLIIGIVMMQDAFDDFSPFGDQTLN